VKKLLAAVLLVPSMANAEFLTGNKLLEHMIDKEIMSRMFALGYVAGVSDAHQGVISCPPPNVTNGQVNDVIKSYLETNPSQRHRSADVLIYEALKRVWPCAPKGTRS